MSFFLDHLPQSETKLFKGLIVEVQKGYYFVIKESNKGFDTTDVWLATLPGRFTNPADETLLLCVGDIVWCSTKEDTTSKTQDLPTCSIDAVKTRLNCLKKPQKRGQYQPIAANIDHAFIVCSISEPKLNLRFLDRYLTVCEDQKIKAVIIFNKSDKLKDLSDEDRKFFEENFTYYQKYYQTIVLSAKIPKTLNQLKSLTANKTTLLVGQSGVGKSSIINQLGPDLLQAIDEMGTIKTKGRHTTSFVSMLALENGGFIIDTPGIKTLTVENDDPVYLGSLFPDFRIYFGKCKYRNCLHQTEHPCAIKQAVDEHLISNSRYRSYLKILEKD